LEGIIVVKPNQYDEPNEIFLDCVKRKARGAAAGVRNSEEGL